MKFCAVVVAAGRGTRFGRPKQLIDIAGKPMLSWSLRTFAQMDEVGAIVVVTESEWLCEVAGVAREAAGAKIHAVVPGGDSRQASTYEGLRAVPASFEGVFVHDGARPLVTAQEVRDGMHPVRPGHAAVLAVPVVDTIKVAGAGRVVTQTLDRSVLWAAQTPQFAMLGDLMRAHQEGLRDGVDATDDAMLLERIGVSVHIVPGSPENFKVTLAQDHARAEAAMRERVCE
ncbi:MAG TPA: 2-C-methyl-D-erythritol 4-phosphate cytidylyltransferase [Candidatus Baltobacteraceae bacterium]|nr:2-C-methyl-D-erythritol 4-phosphate cytidylyltransferase [Candidatus Baltobacteraceae bacterium]